MKTLITNYSIHLSNPKFYNHPLLLFHFPSSPLKPLNPHHKIPNRENLALKFSTASSTPNSPSFGGWDDPQLAGESSELNQFQKLVLSIGIHDRKHVFMFVLGFFCALAVSRVKISSILVFPAFVLVFACGFSFGFVRSVSVNDLSLIGSKRRLKDEIFRVDFEKLKNLVDFFDGLDAKVSNLKSDLRKSIEGDQIEVSDLGRYLNVVDSIGFASIPARSVVEESIGLLSNGGDSNLILEDQNVERNFNQKLGRRRKEIGENGFDLLRFLGGLFGESSFSSKPNKMKDIVKREVMENLVNGQSKGDSLTPTVKELDLNSPNDVGKGRKMADEGKRIGRSVKNGGVVSEENGKGTKRNMEHDEHNHRANGLHLKNDHEFSFKMNHQSEFETSTSYNSLHDSVDFTMVKEEFSSSEKRWKKPSGAYMASYNDEKGENEIENNTHLADHQASSSSPMISDDVLFDRYLTEANGLLKQARKCLKSGGNEGLAETILKNATELLTKAIAMKPMSLLAVGQLGNTYLLHGELKFKISRKLRTLLTRNKPLAIEDLGIVKELDNRVTSKDKIATLLVNACEECEELLVEAGRQYRMALSIDGNDVRALYNWGLALSFRAQLISDIGPEAAFDADKVYLAAIDKFDAMMSKSNVYAPDALFRWGLTLQQRSNLWPSNSKEKVKLLQQAKRLYEDALSMGSDNFQVREALSTCISELDFRDF